MKRGTASFVIYILYTLFGGGVAIWNYIRLQNSTGESGDWSGLGYALLFAIGIVIGVIGLGGVILKGIHLGTGWGFFGFLCIILDIACIYLLVSSASSGGDISMIEASDIIQIIPFFIPPVLSLASNACSLSK